MRTKRGFMLNGLQRHQIGKSCRSISKGVLVALGVALCLSAFPAHSQFTSLTIDGPATSGSIAKGQEKKYSFSPVGISTCYWVDLLPNGVDLDLYGNYNSTVARAKVGTDGIIGHGNTHYSDRYKAQAIDEHLAFRGDGVTTTYYLSVYGYEAGSYTIRVWSSSDIGLNVTYPDGSGIAWTPGQTQTISWSPTSISGQDFHGYDIKLLKDGQETTLVKGLSGTTTSWPWTVAGTSSSNYRIKVIGYRLMAPPPVNNPKNQVQIEWRDDTSTNSFTIGSGSSTAVNGRVIDQNSNGLSGLPIKFYLNGNYQSSPSATTDSTGFFSGTLTQSGTWSFATVYQGTDKLGNPKYITVGLPPTVTFDTLTIQTVANSTKIYGYVRDSQSGSPLSGSLVELRYQGSTVKGSATTNASGYYQIDGKADVTGQYDCKATYNGKTGYSNSFNITSSSSSVKADISIDTTSQTYSISGTITNASTGAAISCALIQLSGTGLSASSNSSGYYTLGEVSGNQSYTLAVSKNGFTPANISTDTLIGNLTRNLSLQPSQATYDLIPQSITPSKTSYSSAETMNVSVNVYNGGLANGGAFSIGIYASTNENGSITGDILLGDIDVGSAGIPVGQTNLFSKSYSLTSLAQGQPYFLKAYVDRNHNWPQEEESNNILSSSLQIVVQSPPMPQQYTMGRLKINGVFTNVDTNTFTVAPGGTVNDWVQLPKTAIVHKDTQEITWNNGLILKPSPLPGLTGDSWQVLSLPAVTIDASTGSVLEVLTTQSPLSFLIPVFPMKANFLTLNPYAQGGFQASYSLLLPLSRSAIQTLLTHSSVIATLPFGATPKGGWLKLDATGGFNQSGIQLSVQQAGKVRIDNFPLVFEDISGGIDTAQKTLTFGGKVSFPLIEGLWINLDYVTLKNYCYLDSFKVSVEDELPVYPPGGIPYTIFGLDKLTVKASSLTDRRNEDYAWGLGGGIMLGYAEFNIPGLGQAKMKAFHFEGLGTYRPNVNDFTFEASAKLYPFDCQLFSFDGLDLAGATIHYDITPRRLDAEGYFTLLDILRLNLDTFVFDGRANAVTAFHGTGRLQVPKVELNLGFCKMKIWDGFELGDAEAWSISNLHGAWMWGIARAKVATYKGLGFHYTVGGKFDVGTDLYKEYAGKSSGAESPEMVLVPAGQKFAVIRVSYPTGTANVSLTAPTVPTPTTYDSVNAAITEAYNGPVFYRANDQVEEDGQLRNEVCFYLNPVEGQHEVLPGQYTVNIQNPNEIGAYEVQLWLSNEAPAIVVTEPSVPTVVDPQAPQPVHIAFSGNDPDDDSVQIYLYYDTDQNGHDGQLINFESNSQNVGPLPLPKTVTGYGWNTTGLPTGDYYVYAMITDGKNLPVFSNYAPGKISVVHPEAPEPPSNLGATAVANSITCTWTPSPTTGAQYLLLYDDLPLDSTERYQSAMGAEDLTTWAIPNLTYGRTYRVALVAVNPDTLDRSPLLGPVSVPLFSTTANNAPKIVSEPITEGRVGIPYSYQVVATDPDGDALTFALMPHTVDGHPELASPPPGVTIDASTGLIAFTPVDGHLGTNKIIVQVSDAKGGTDSQEFYINIDNWLSSNSAPSFTSTPPTVAYVDEAFTYQAVADDPDQDQVIYSLQNAPSGMTIGTTSGLIAWHPTAADHGDYLDIVIQASDGKGGTTTQALPLSVQYRALTSVFTVNPDAPQICPAEFVFTAHPNTPYVTNYAWDFGDGTLVSGPDKQAVRHVFSDYAPGDFPGNKIHNVTLTVTGPGNPASQVVVSAPVPVAIRAPQPTVDFTASSWSGTSPLDVTLTASAQWVNPEASGGYAWDLDNDGLFDDATTSTLTHQFTAAFPQKFPVGLKVTGPSGVKHVYKTIITQPSTGTTFNVINHPEGTEPYWPYWRKAVTGDIEEETLADPFNLSTSPTQLTLSTDVTGNAIAVSKTYTLNNGAFDFTFQMDATEGEEEGEAEGEVWYVDRDALGADTGTSWENAFKTIQAGIDAAFTSGGGEVWVGAGVYGESRDNATGSVILKPGVRIYGGFAGTETMRSSRNVQNNLTTIDGATARAGEAAYHVVIGANNSKIDGFTIMNGVGLIPATAGDPNGTGGGMYNLSSSPIIQNCTFTSNTAEWGGGLANIDNSSPQVLNCIFSNNTAPEDGGGILNLNNSSPDIEKCIFIANLAGNGGGVLNGASSCPALINCLFYENRIRNIGVHVGTGGAAIHSNSFSTPIITNCTITNNIAEGGSGAGLYSTDSIPVVTNCIVWGNSPDQLSPTSNFGTVTYSNIQGGYVGSGNINIDPLFVNPAAGNYRLQPVSPCIDTGTSAGAPNVDIENKVRPIDIQGKGLDGAGEGFDMGAYESHDVLRWVKVAESSIPPAYESQMVYDAARGVSMLLLGTDTWLWNGTTWMKHPTLTCPSSNAGMTFDTLRGKAVVFSLEGDTWEWDGTSWTQVATSGPSGRATTQMAFDSSRGKTVLFSGYNPGGVMWTDTWEWDGSSWTQVSNTGPPPRYFAGMVYDTFREKVVLFGGRHETLGQFFGDTWEWDGIGWIAVSASGPAARYCHTLAYDSHRGVCVMFGGTDLSHSPDGPMFSDTWQYDGIAWMRANTIEAPCGRWRHMMTYDSLRKQIVLFGGRSGWWDGVTLGDTWVLGGESAVANTKACISFSPSDYVRFSAHASNAMIERISVLDGFQTVIVSDSGALSEAWTSQPISIRYDGSGTFEVFENDTPTGITISTTPGGSVTLGLGLDNTVQENASATFNLARLTLPNNPPQITSPLPPVTIISGTFDDSTDLNALAGDDLTSDTNLSFTVSGGSHVDAQVDPATHRLILSAHPGVTGSPTDVLQIVVTDEGGLSAQSTIAVTVTPESAYQFTNIGTIAQIEEAGRSGLDASMGFLTSADFVNLFATKTGQATLLANSGNNVYSSVAAPAVVGNEPHAAIGDFDSDGKPDVFIVSETGSKLYQGDGLGNFVDVTAPPLDTVTGKSCVWVDVDSDGDLDLYVVCNGANRFFLNELIGSGTASFTEATNANGLNDAGNGTTAVFADVNGDGAADCYVANLGGNALYLNNGSGIFTLAAGSGTELTGDSHSAVFADFNNDGSPDLYVAKDGGDVLLMNSGNGTFTNVTVAAGLTNAVSSRGVAALDYDNDGYLDIFASNNGSPNALYHNNGNGTFTYVTAQSGVAGPADGAGMGAAVGDIENDGDVDIWQVNTSGQPAALFRNNLIGPLDDPQLTPNHHWLEIRLIGAASSTSTPNSFTNPSAIGARVELWKNGRLWQTRILDGGPNSPSLHFGVGADTVAEQIVVRWPSGNVSCVSMIAANQILNLTEERVLDGLFLSPGRLSLTVGQAQECSATAHYANGVTEPLNASDLFWSVEHEAVARVDALGMVVGVQNGMTQITARLNGVVSLPVDIEVADAPLASVVVTPVQARLVGGDSQPYRATAEYWNGTSLDVTSTATWHSDTQSVATISSTGVATAHAAGTVHITAVFRDVTSNAVTLDVVSDVTTALELNARESRFYNEAVARTNPFVALKTFSDGSPAVDVSNQVTWLVDNPFVAWINASGQFQTTSPGQASLQAQQGSLHSNSLPVNVANHISFTQTPAAEIKKYLGDNQTFTVSLTGGFEPFTYQWSKDGSPLGPNSAPLEIPIVGAADAGSYRASAFDSFNDSLDSNTSVLKVAPHLSFVVSLPDIVEKNSGESADFLVQMEGGFEPLAYQWYKEDDTKVLVPVGTNSSGFSIQNLADADAGMYQVQVIDSNTDYQEDSTTLIVTQALPIAGLAGLSILLGMFALTAIRKMRKK